MDRPLQNSRKAYLKSNSCEPSKLSKTIFQTLLKSRDGNLLRTKYTSQEEKLHCLRNSCLIHLQKEESQTKQLMKQFVKTLRKSPPIENNQSEKRCLSSQNSSRVINKKIIPITVARNEKQNQSQLAKKNPEISILQHYEKRVQELIKMKLLKRFQNRSHLSARIQEDDIEKDLQQILIKIKEYEPVNEEIDDNEQIQNDLTQIDRKISILEKIIAESYSQSEMIKKFYYAKKLLRNVQTHKIKSEVIKIEGNSDKNKTKNSSFLKSPYIHLKTSSQINYIKPKRQDYEPRKDKENRYIPNRQNLPKSSYQKDFFDYGPLPVYNHRKSETFVANSIYENRKTIYQGDFQSKSTTVYDSKSLDCRRDKIKNGKVPFMGKEYSTAPQNLKPALKKKNKLQHQKMDSSLPAFTRNLFRQSQSAINLNKSQSQTQYKGEKLSISSFIKDKNLSNLKYSFINYLQN